MEHLLQLAGGSRAKAQDSAPCQHWPGRGREPCRCQYDGRVLEPRLQFRHASQRLLARRTLRRVRLVRVEEQLLVGQSREVIGNSRAPAHTAVAVQPLAKGDRALVCLRRDPVRLLPRLALILHLLLLQDRLLKVKEDLILVQERWRQQVGEEPRDRSRVDGEAWSLLAVPPLDQQGGPHQPAPTGLGRHEVDEQREGGSTLVLRLDVHVARRAEVHRAHHALHLRLLGSILQAFDDILEAALVRGLAYPFDLDGARVCVPVRDDVVVCHRHMRWIRDVLHGNLEAIWDVAVRPHTASRATLHRRIIQLLWLVRLHQRTLQGCIRRAFAPHPQDAVAQLRRADRGTSPLVLQQPGQILRLRLRNRRDLSLAVEAPTVVGTEQTTILLNAAFAQWHVPVRTAVFEHTPLSIAALPSDQVLAQQHELIRPAGVEVLNHGAGVPSLGPVELLPPLVLCEVLRLELHRSLRLGWSCLELHRRLLGQHAPRPRAPATPGRRLLPASRARSREGPHHRSRSNRCQQGPPRLRGNRCRRQRHRRTQCVRWGGSLREAVRARRRHGQEGDPCS
mmetsp:Transcript_27515/g.78769  ORF Transcript_27515/g.78769 Transcript_27515/m.78769 type:complete len:565 (+) Transcript_27515:113-1807(+)